MSVNVIYHSEIYNKNSFFKSRCPLDGQDVQSCPLDGQDVQPCPLDGQDVQSCPLDGQDVPRMEVYTFGCTIGYKLCLNPLFEF